MSQHEDRDLLPTERVGLVVYTFVGNRGKVFTTVELAAMVGLRPNSMWRMLTTLGRLLPIVQEPNGQGWRMMESNGGVR